MFAGKVKTKNSYAQCLQDNHLFTYKNPATKSNILMELVGDIAIKAWKYYFWTAGKERQGRRLEGGVGQQTDVQARHPQGAAGEERGRADLVGHHRGEQGQPGRVPAHRAEEGVRLPPQGHSQDGAVSFQAAGVVHVLWADHHGVERPGELKLAVQANEDLDDYILQVILK